MILFVVFFHKSHIWKKCGSRDMGQNAYGESDYIIFKSSISLEQNDEKAWFLACQYRFMEIRSCLKYIGVSVVKNWCCHSVVRTLKLAVSQGKMNEANWFLLCWYKFMKAKLL